MIPASSSSPPLAGSTEPPGWAVSPGSPRLGRFVLGPELGRGGMGVVHLAWDPMLRRQVALKRLLNADPVMALRFMREAQIQAKVEHPRICKVFEVGSEGEHPFIAMQYIQGQTLGEAKDDLGVEEKASIMADVAGAIHAAHQMGLVHRDIKPSNILLEFRDDGTCVPYILDFGLARDQSVADLTLSWGLVGTPAFMSPEQAEGCPATQSSDIYSLGATFYALFSGHPPFEATTLAGLIHQQDTQTVRSLRRTMPVFPTDLDTIVLACVDPEPARRYASAADLEADLRRWLKGEPIHAHAIGPLGKAWRKAKRHQTLSLAIAAGLTLTLSLLGWNIREGRRTRTEVELAQRFGLQVREVEQLLRIERMLPVHDVRPAEAQLRQRMTEIQATMTRLGSVAEGPGHYALGRGHLVLREFPAAEKELEEAWRAGFRSPEAAYAMGTTLLERYLSEASSLRASRPAEPQAAFEALRTRYADKALSFFEQTHGQAQEDPAFGEAQVAMLKADYPRCIQKCREAIASKPWMYEAKLLEARAWLALPLGLAGPKPSPMAWEHALKEAEGALQTALKIGQSDERIYACEMERLTDLSVLQADYGKPSTELFERADAIFSQALKIHQDDLAFRIRWLIARARHGFLLLRMGKDVRPLMQESLQIFLPDEPRIREAGSADWLGHLFWILADGQWRRGEDPLPALAEADRRYAPDGFMRTQPAALKAAFLDARGGDPLPVLKEAESILQATANRKDLPFYSYHGTVHGMILLTRARWEWSQGIDPSRTLEEARERLEANRDLDPRSVYPHFYLAQVHALLALRTASLGGDPEAALRVARLAAQRALQLYPAHFHAHLTMAEVCQVQARLTLLRGGDATPFLQAGRAAVQAGLALNPTDFRLLHQRAALELVASRRESDHGNSPVEALSRAEAAARQGLGFKPDAAGLWLVLARAARCRAEWVLKQGGSPAPHLAEGQKRLHRALALHPGLGEAMAEQAILDWLQTGNKGVSQEKLKACLRRNPFLGLEYRPL